jgi:SulP family sulfate permease
MNGASNGRQNRRGRPGLYSRTTPSVRETLKSPPAQDRSTRRAGRRVGADPGAIAFSIIAGVDPRLGLFASFTMAVTIAFIGAVPP